MSRERRGWFLAVTHLLNSIAELFCSDIENQDPGAKRGPAASNGLVLLDEDWTIRDKESQSGSAPDVMSSDETQSVITFGSQGRSKSIKSPIPLMNLKNSCYMNSVVQSLIAFPEFIVSLQRYLNSESHATRNDENSNELMDRTNSQAENPIGVRFPIIKALVKLFLDYETERRRESNEEKTTDMRYRLERLKEKVGNQSKQFLSDNQQDAGEFFSFLMDAASDEFKRAKSPSLIDNWMAMTTETRMTCCTCRRVSDPVVTHSTSTYLAVPEQSEDRDDDPELNLQRLLTNSLQEVDRREYPCPAEGCEGRETDASRTIAKLPKILVIQMSRISLAGEKIERPVEVDHTLSITSGATPVEEDELTAVTDKRCVRYELKSVICHIGPSTTKGHYYSLTRNHVNGSWYDCDDHEIKRVNFDQVCADGRIYGYCFFYEKID